MQDEVDDLKKQAQQIKETMLMMVMGGVNSVTTKDCEDNECDAVDVLHIKFNDLMEWYDECNTKMLDLYYYKEYLENKKQTKQLKTCPNCSNVIGKSNISCSICNKHICSKCKIEEKIPKFSRKNKIPICQECKNLLESTKKNGN